MAKIVKSITIDEETYKEIEMLCNILNRNFSNYVESLLKEEVKSKQIILQKTDFFTLIKDWDNEEN